MLSKEDHIINIITKEKYRIGSFCLFTRITSVVGQPLIPTSK